MLRLKGGRGADAIQGGSEAERIRGLGGADTLLGGAGDDRLLGGRGADSLRGGEGDDVLISGRGRGETLAGGPGDDRLIAKGPSAALLPGEGADVVRGDGEAGLSYADLDAGVRVDLRGGWARGELTDDRVRGVNSAEGGAYDDVLKGGATAEWEGFAPGPGDDRIDGRGGYDEAIWLRGPEGVGVSVDLEAGKARDPWGDLDLLKRVEAVTGTLWDDRLTGGGENFESFRGLAGRDRIDGQGGADRADYSLDAAMGGGAGVVVNLARGRAIDGFGDRDRLLSIESVRGTDFADVIRGDGRDNNLMGEGGDDLLRGGAGRDRLWAGEGRDEAWGGRGGDVFRFIKGDGRLMLGDFGQGADRLRLEDYGRLDQFHEIEMIQRGEDAVLRLPKGDRVILLDTPVEDLDPSQIWLA